MRRPRPPATGLVLAGVLALAGTALAHGVSRGDAAFLEGSAGAQVAAFVYLGAKHMVTGYDHLLFLAGVVFFLHRMRDVVHYVTVFTVGHSATLLAGVLGGVHASPYLVDAVIGLSVAYKGFDNLDGFGAVLGWRPDTKLAVLVFGLFHGFGLATKVQDLSLSREGLVVNMLSFNLGVELGQALALAFILIGMAAWRRREGFARQALGANWLLMTAGFLLAGFQLAGYVLA